MLLPFALSQGRCRHSSTYFLLSLFLPASLIHAMGRGQRGGREVSKSVSFPVLNSIFKEVDTPWVKEFKADTSAYTHLISISWMLDVSQFLKASYQRISRSGDIFQDLGGALSTHSVTLTRHQPNFHSLKICFIKPFFLLTPGPNFCSPTPALNYLMFPCMPK